MKTGLMKGDYKMDMGNKSAKREKFGTGGQLNLNISLVKCTNVNLFNHG